MPGLSGTLKPEKGLIFRVTHRSNVPWILKHGLHCAHSSTQDPRFVSIGNSDLIERRRRRAVPIPPGGTLDDYVPFYFTPFSPMLYNIKTGYGGIQRRSNEEIVILVSALPRLLDLGTRFVFTDRHAYLRTATFHADLSQLGDAVDYPLLRRRDFERDSEDPEKVDRYQAEALVHEHLPVNGLLGIVCYDEATRSQMRSAFESTGSEPTLHVRTGWYFR